MATSLYTEECLDRSLWFEPLGPGGLSKEELAILKNLGEFDPEVHLKDGSIAGYSAEDQKLRRQQIINDLNLLHPALKSIVDAELKRGNRVCSAGHGYPAPGSINVTLSLRFTKQHESSNTIFTRYDDPHYGRADYRTVNEPVHLLIC